MKPIIAKVSQNTITPSTPTGDWIRYQRGSCKGIITVSNYLLQVSNRNTRMITFLDNLSLIKTRVQQHVLPAESVTFKCDYRTDGRRTM